MKGVFQGNLKEVTFKLTLLMALVCATGAETSYKLDLQFRVFKHDGMSFTIPINQDI